MKVGDVLLTDHAWVAGANVRAVYGQFTVEMPVNGKSWEDAIDGILETAAARARVLGGNAVTSVQISIDPYRGPAIALSGTAVSIESLYAGIPLEVAS